MWLLIRQVIVIITNRNKELVSNLKGKQIIIFTIDQMREQQLEQRIDRNNRIQQGILRIKVVWIAKMDVVECILMDQMWQEWV